jgi:hypothetical protein
MDKNQSAEEIDETTETNTSKSRPGYVLLLLCALGLLVGGAALAAIPLVAEHYAWIAAGCAKNGVYGAPVALTGVVLFGLWLVARGRDTVGEDEEVVAAREKEAHEREEAQTLVLDQLASDLALARGGMQELRVEFVYLKDLVQSAQKDGLDPTTGLHEAQAAIFRLAGSMDQLGGRLEQRLKAQDTAVHEVMGLLRSELSTTTNSLLDLRARIEQGIQDATTHAASAGITMDHGRRIELDVDHDEVDFSEADELDLEPGYQVGPDDLSVEVELEEDAVRGLGLLDELDELGAPQLSKTSPSIRPSIPRTNTYADLGLDASTDGALPVENGRISNALTRRDIDEGDEVDQKLALLRALMSDPDVRGALEAARHRT